MSVIALLFCLLAARRVLPVALAKAGVLGGVLVLLSAAPAEVHPAHVVPVADPVAGVPALQVLDHGRAARGSCRGRAGGNSPSYLGHH